MASQVLVLFPGTAPAPLAPRTPLAAQTTSAAPALAIQTTSGVHPLATPLATQTTSGARGKPTLFDLPQSIRDRIYDHVFRGDAPVWDIRDPHQDPDVSGTRVPTDRLAVLCTSRRVYEEASAVLYSTVYLGPYAPEAFKYLESIGRHRVRQIRTLVLSYKCQQACNTSYGYGWDLYWTPVFGLLYQSWACVRHVRVLFGWCTSLCGHGWRLDTGCRLRWDAENDTFFAGLRTLTMAEHIDFMVPVPEYFAYRHARELGWKTKGRIGGGEDGTLNAFTRYWGLLVNPTFPIEFGRILAVHRLIKQGYDVSVLSPNWDKATRKKIQSTLTNPAAVASPKKHLFDLPLEIRQAIYDFSCEWVERACWPSKALIWNTGVDLLCTCKQVAREALPSVYRNFRIYAPSTIDILNRLGPRASHIQHLKLNFTCFCPSSLDRRDGFRKSIYAQEEASSLGSGCLIGYIFSNGTYQRYHNMWSWAMTSIQALRAVKELKVTFSSCCRYPGTAYRGGWSLLTPAPQRGCRALEDHFLDLLAGCRHVNRLVLVGDVPPSFPIRVSRRTLGVSLRLVWINPQMRDFMERPKEERDEGKSAPYPDTFY